MVYSIIKSLMIPPGILILMLIAAFFLVRGVLGRLLIFTVVTLMTLMSLSPVGIKLMEPLEVYPALGTRATPIPPAAQAIVILSAGRVTGAPEYGGDTLDDASLRRVRYGAKLSRTTGLPLYVTGGAQPGEDPPMGILMANLLRDDYGIVVAGIESKSQTSWENAAYTAPLLIHDGVTHILLVSDAWHLPRAVDAFEGAGLSVTPAPTAFAHYPGWEAALTFRDWLPSARAFLLSYLAIHEHLGRAWYQIRTWIQGPPRMTEAAAWTSVVRHRTKYCRYRWSIREELLVKYAAKRTWPEKQKSWEFQGEADTAEAFSREFAASRQLDLDTEFVIMEKEGDDAEIQFFRVIGCSPYQVASAEPRAAGDASEGKSKAMGADGVTPAQGDADDHPEPLGVPNLSPVISMLLYMAKVGFIATASIAIMAVVIGYIKRALS